MNTMSTTTSSRSTTSTTSRRNPHADLQINDIREMYQEIFGRKMPYCIERDVRSDLEDDQSGESVYDWYIYALEEAAAAPMPSWRYVQAIMRRLMAGMNRREYTNYQLPK